MNTTLKNLTKLRISGMLSEAARLEVERKLGGTQKPETSEASENIASANFFQD